MRVLHRMFQIRRGHLPSRTPPPFRSLRRAWRGRSRRVFRVLGRARDAGTRLPECSPGTGPGGRDSSSVPGWLCLRLAGSRGGTLSGRHTVRLALQCHGSQACRHTELIPGRWASLSMRRHGGLVPKSTTPQTAAGPRPAGERAHPRLPPPARKRRCETGSSLTPLHSSPSPLIFLFVFHQEALGIVRKEASKRPVAFLPPAT